jgi:hypothetical protein
VRAQVESSATSASTKVPAGASRRWSDQAELAAKLAMAAILMAGSGGAIIGALT